MDPAGSFRMLIHIATSHIETASFFQDIGTCSRVSDWACRFLQKVGTCIRVSDGACRFFQNVSTCSSLVETAGSFRTLVPAVESHMELTGSCRILVPTVESQHLWTSLFGISTFLGNLFWHHWFEILWLVHWNSTTWLVRQLPQLSFHSADHCLSSNLM